MSDNERQDQVVSRIRQWLAEARMYHQARIDRIASLEHELASPPTGLTHAGTGKVVSNGQGKIMVANGRRLAQEEIASLNEDNFEVILDMTTHRLRYRQDPAEHTKLKESRLWHVGKQRITILAYMFEHPSRCICEENAPTAYGDPDLVRTSNAFTQTISLLRKALGTPGWANPYVLSEPAWELSSRRNARAYRLNPKWKYLLIKWPSKKSYQDQSLVSSQSETSKTMEM